MFYHFNILNIVLKTLCKILFLKSNTLSFTNINKWEKVHHHHSSAFWDIKDKVVMVKIFERCKDCLLNYL